ncbi:MAG TPA: anthranilate synthase component I family protein [Niabella sp.]|nr:anthranilate synthase component I family protein [Niabella sp.]HOZ97613.1 anthranilate synthase component I family protein [Niabella sp.]HQW15751.1 anthranilate synthase component I family protein [Niabella sp.]HQX21026.1 anthranilate synthase component I family protein [Niabella sp.]HQX41877.1 anthranilate synthase component I family protein [Niabella sp.]
MQKIRITTHVSSMLADVYTPVSIFLRLRDRFRDTILLESTDNHVTQNSWSFIGINAIAGIEMNADEKIELKYPGQIAETIEQINGQQIVEILDNFMKQFEVVPSKYKEALYAQGLYGYTSYDAIRFFETIPSTKFKKEEGAIPLLRYRLYQYIIAINHFKDELYICDNEIEGIKSERELLLSLIRGKDVPVYPFNKSGEESSNMTDEHYREMVRQGIAHCYRGDVFQIVLSRRFQQSFTGDEFNVYRSLRNINPSPYLFYFDYGDYKILGSSPESQLIIQDNKAIVHPIAGTVKRTGNDKLDAAETIKLENDPKENAEHVMLVDLARNDLSRGCSDVKVAHFRETHYYSHVIHLVSEVVGNVHSDTYSFELLAKTFPAGTLSGAPKIKAMQLINGLEPTPRGYYGGAVGFMGFNGNCNQAIMIRTFMSKNNTLFYQAGAGVVAASLPENELQEVNNKLGALKKAIEVASEVN